MIDPDAAQGADVTGGGRHKTAEYPVPGSAPGILVI